MIPARDEVLSEASGRRSSYPVSDSDRSNIVLDTTSRLPLTVQVRDHVAASIRRRNLSPGAKLPSVRAAAREWGIGLTTVARAYDLLRKDGVIVVRRGQGAFVGPVANAPAKTKIFLCIHPAFLSRSDLLVFERMQGIIAAAAQRGIDLQALTSGSQFTPPAEGVQFGVLLFDENYEIDGFGNVARYVLEHGIPCCLGSYSEGLPFPCVRNNRAEGFERATEHLIHSGHRRIALLNCSARYQGSEFVVRGNREGYLRALARAGLVSDPELYVETIAPEEEHGTASTWEAVDLLLSRSPCPTAIVCNNDRRALAVLEILKARGLRVPDDISLVGYDNRPECEKSVPPLTSVNTQRVAQGEQAVHYIVSLLQGKKAALPSVTPRVVVRASSGVPAAQLLVEGRIVS